jgi:hypothetical protein
LNSGGVLNGDWNCFGHYLTHLDLQMATKTFRLPHLLSIEIFFDHHRVQWSNCFLVAIGYDDLNFSSCHRVDDDRNGSSFWDP